MDVSFDDRYIVSCSKDKTIKIWETNTGQLVRTISAHRGPVNAVQLRGNKIVSASGDGLIKMWNVETGECIREFAGHHRGLTCVQYDGRRIVSGSNDRTVKLWDAEVKLSFHIFLFPPLLLFPCTYPTPFIYRRAIVS